MVISTFGKVEFKGLYLKIADVLHNNKVMKIKALSTFSTLEEHACKLSAKKIMKKLFDTNTNKMGINKELLAPSHTMTPFDAPGKQAF